MTRIATFRNPKNYLKTIPKVPSKTKKKVRIKIEGLFWNQELDNTSYIANCFWFYIHDAREN
jgi:hypothetical protein